MPMVMRPLGEILCRLPAFDTYQPQPNVPPTQTAGPTFEVFVEQNPEAGLAAVAPPAGTDQEIRSYFVGNLANAGTTAGALATAFPFGKAIRMGDTSIPDRLTWLSQNLTRMSQNFGNYWDGTIVAPIPSKDFQNLPGIN